MPQFTHDDRCMIEAEAIVFAAAEFLNGIEHAGAFSPKIKVHYYALVEIAKEMRAFNDQFEDDD